MPIFNRNATQLPTKIIKSIETLFDGTLGTLKTNTLDFELKEDVKPICSIKYTVLKLHLAMFNKEV